MAKLKIDMDQMKVAQVAFQTLQEDFEAAYSGLDRAIQDLKDSGWVSGASAAYFLQYDDGWKQNMEKHMKVLAHLQDCLEMAGREYQAVVDALPNLGNGLPS